jgi:hypothetical protein
MSQKSESGPTRWTGGGVLFSRKPKRFDEMVTDSVFPYQVGRLVGSAEMAGHLLTSQEHPDVKQIGERLLAQVNWFYHPPDIK